MIEELEKLSLTLDFVAKDDAIRIIDVVNNKLADTLNAHIIDVLWKQEGQVGVILNPFSSFNKSKRGDLKAYEIPKDPTEKTGLWTWVYKNEKPIWIEEIRSKNLKKPIRNLATRKNIGTNFLNIFRGTDSIMAIPLFFRKTIWGIYSVESQFSGKFTREILEYLEDLSKPIAIILWKAEAQKLNQKHTHDAVSIFANFIRKFEPTTPIPQVRSGLVARPFRRDFEIIENSVKQFLKKNEILAKHYEHPPGRDYVIDGIMREIRSSHFGIVDITGLNPNVMMELGMMMILHKKFIILRRMGDKRKLPFNIRPYHFYEYKVERGDIIQIWNPGKNIFEPIERILRSFVKELEGDPNFVAAKPSIQ